MGECVSSPTLTLETLFDKEAPFYMSIGVSYNDFWNGDPKIAKFALDAFNLKQEREIEQLNFNAWLQGTYIHQATYSAVAYCLNPKEAERAGIKYFDEPMSLFSGSNNEPTEEELKKAQQESLDWMRELYTLTNNRFK